INQVLQEHNSLRAKKGAPSLTWGDGDLYSYAVKVANTCDYRESSGKYGENLAPLRRPGSLSEAIKLWAKKKSDYNSIEPQGTEYTQLVWKGTTQVACAIVSCPTLANSDLVNQDFVVCEYSPSGN
ncbi:MAG: CAP domain-containing protein, partial [Linnemannia gamsii]